MNGDAREKGRNEERRKPGRINGALGARVKEEAPSRTMRIYGLFSNREYNLSAVDPAVTKWLA